LDWRRFWKIPDSRDSFKNLWWQQKTTWGGFVLWDLSKSGITKNSKVTKEMESIPESDFKEKFRDKEKITETEITLKDIPFRAGVIMHENGKRYGFRTTIPKENISDIKVIASFIPARWRQENKFEEVKNGEDVDKIARYEFLAAPNIHLQNKYDELQNQLQKVGERRVKKEEEMEILSKQYEKKKQTYEKRLGTIGISEMALLLQY
jgi:hypothetical protein